MVLVFQIGMLPAGTAQESGEEIRYAGLANISTWITDADCRIPWPFFPGEPTARTISFFRLPPAVRLDSLPSPFHAVDLIKKGLCITPGSRHQQLIEAAKRVFPTFLVYRFSNTYPYL